MIDVHCHLNFHAFAKDYDELIHKAHTKGVTKIINVGTKIDSSEKAAELALIYDNLYAIIGVHPHHADKIELGINDQKLQINGKQEVDGWIVRLENLAKNTKVVALGEIGLDFYRYQSNGIVDSSLQKYVFESQLQLAHKLNLPIQIHNRHAGKEILEILESHKSLLKSSFPGMFHCFAGDKKILKKALDLGFMIGFDGNSTYPGLAPGETVSQAEIAELTPLDRILTETDSPFLTPIPFRGTRNEPSYVIIVGEFLAKLKGISFEEFDHQTERNAIQLFNL